jgi:cyclopropane fatty-acyl-phospholipid synthase-like methyltransferase
VHRVQRSGFEILWSCEHGRHYALTTAAWLGNVEANKGHFQQLLGQREYRLFVGYLALASQLFGSGRGSLGRYVLRKLD